MTSEVLDAIAGQAADYRAQYAAWRAGGPADLERLGPELRALRITAGQIQAAALAAGDAPMLAGAQTLIGEIDQAIADRESAVSTADYYSGTWDALAALLGTGAWFGLGAPVVPVALSVAVAVAGVGALAWTVNTWQTLRAKTNQWAVWTAAVQAGSLTSGQVADLAGGWSAGSGASVGTFLSGLNLGVVLLGAVALWWLARGRT